ncbi:oxygenase MpaB family protein [Rhodococcus sp. Q]|uniref:oxygenase MpaB family protein n=1 Tax=Rhodococcus sp. Q TaxID=2502252 RepID=UPI0010F81D2E|nr:oxygenase MpaB family protein [Rhodococcus sp. Q]
MAIHPGTEPEDATAVAPTGELRCPTGFRYWETKEQPGAKRAERLLGSTFGFELFPPSSVAERFCESLFHGDPLAEHFVDEVYENDPKAGRALLDRALTEGLGSIENPAPSMHALFDEFETVPDWVDPELVERGAAVWRRWGTMLFAVAGGITLEMYTEAAVATPLSLAGGYAGDNALRRYLETSRFWIDVSEPGALLTPGSAGRATAMRVRVMHVAVRRKVDGHPEWDTARWGYPISQGYQMLTLLGGSTVPALALRLVGIHTSRSDMNALLHFQKYMGYLLGVDISLFPETIADSMRLNAMVVCSRSYDAGAPGRELIESFPAAFAPRPDQRGLERLRARYTHAMYAAYTTLFMSPATRAKHDMPSPFPGILVVVLRWPLLTVAEYVRRASPRVNRLWERITTRHRESWYRAQMAGREAEFNAHGGLRR